MFNRLKNAASGVSAAAQEKIATAAARVTSNSAKPSASDGGDGVDRVEEANTLEGQDLTFFNAWNCLGVSNAAIIFDTIGIHFEQVARDPQKTDLAKALLFLTGSNQCKPYRMVSVTLDESKSTAKIDCAEFDDLAVFETTIAEMKGVQSAILTVDDTRNFGSISGHIEHFLSFEAIAACLPKIIECFEVSNKAVVELLVREFQGLSSTFSGFTHPISAMNDEAAEFSKERGIARHVVFKLPINIKKLSEFNFPWAERICNWFNRYSVEILDKHVPGQTHSKRRAISARWDRDESAFVLEAVKAGDSLLWHNKDGMVQSVFSYNKRVPTTITPENKVSFSVGSSFVIRVNISLCLVDVGVFSLGSSGTSLYFNATLREDRSIELNLIDISGLSGRVAKLAFSNSLETVAESVRMICKLIDPATTTTSSSSFPPPPPPPKESPGAAIADPTSLRADDAAAAAAAASSIGCDPPLTPPPAPQLDSPPKTQETTTNGSNHNLQKNDNQVKVPINILQYHVSGIAPANSGLFYIFRKVWEMVVLSGFFPEACELWGMFWRGLAADIIRHDEQSQGAANSLQRKIVTAIRGGELSIEDVRSIFIQVAEALSAQVKRGHISGDLRPESITFQTPDYKWRVEQFGQPVKIGGVLEISTVNQYTAPEAVVEETEGCVEGPVKMHAGLVAATSFDIWSLGMILYQLCHPSLQPLVLPSASPPRVETKDKICAASTGSTDINDYNNVGGCHTRTEGKAVALARKLVKLSACEIREALDVLPHREARVLISQMLQIDPKRRLPLERVLQHPFVTLRKSTRLPGEQPLFDVFISYRVASDLTCAEALYDALTALDLRVWWDKRCLKAGQPWEEGFCEGLVSSATFVAILSRDAINSSNKTRQNFSELTENSPCDNVLLEWRLALELKERGMIEGIFPLFVGDLLSEDGTQQYSDYFASGCHPSTLPEVDVLEVDRKLGEHLDSQGLGTAYDRTSSVRRIVSTIVGNQGHFLRGDVTASMQEAAKSIEKMVRSTRNMRG